MNSGLALLYRFT